jgi:hypothetical protein
MSSVVTDSNVLASATQIMERAMAKFNNDFMNCVILMGRKRTNRSVKIKSIRVKRSAIPKVPMEMNNTNEIS